MIADGLMSIIGSPFHNVANPLPFFFHVVIIAVALLANGLSDSGCNFTVTVTPTLFFITKSACD